MSKYYSFKIEEIMANAMLSRNGKREKLHALEAQAKDLLRAATGGSASDSGDTGDDLAEVRFALARLEGEAP